MKPDDLYVDKGISSNEHVIEEAEHSKPDSLSLQKSSTKKAAPHFTQLVQNEQTDQHLTPTASPKPSRGALKNAGSRSPSPATTTAVSISRKSSFCSLFKSKEAASPDSPSGQRKKSAISILLDSPRDRSRSKSRESEKSGGGLSANSTPSKQRSVLAIFKPRKNSSKSSSPIDPEMHEIMSKQEHQSRKQTHKQEEEFEQRPGSTTPRLRYYDKPRDPHEGIIIPLHTPPEDKENVTFAETIVSSQSTNRPVPSTQVTTHVDIIEPAPSPTAAPSSATKPKTPDRRPKLPITKCVISTSTTPTASTQPKIKKSYRIELPDGSIRIPLRTPSDERNETDDAENNSQLWSTAVQQNSSQESQDTVISSKAASIVGEQSSGGEAQVTKSSVISAVVSVQTPPVTGAAEQKSATSPKQNSQEETTVATVETANGGIRAISKERKRILFSTKIGSGSEEQIFATQLSLSKTESLSSQLSEQGPNLESPSTEKTENVPRDEQTPSQQQSPPQVQPTEVVVRMRSKEDRDSSKEDKVEERHVGKHEVINVNRHSMFIENIDEIMATQRRIDAERKSTIAKEKVLVESVVELFRQRPPKPERASKGQSPKSRDSVEERRNAAGSSGSEHDSEVDPKV